MHLWLFFLKQMHKLFLFSSTTAERVFFSSVSSCVQSENYWLQKYYEMSGVIIRLLIHKKTPFVIYLFIYSWPFKPKGNMINQMLLRKEEKKTCTAFVIFLTEFRKLTLILLCVGDQADFWGVWLGARLRYSKCGRRSCNRWSADSLSCVSTFVPRFVPQTPPRLCLPLLNSPLCVH